MVGSKKLALFVLCAAMFLDSLDVSLVGVALPSIERDLDLSHTTLQWLVSGYTVAYGGLLLLGGQVADLFGRRRVFIAAMGVFAVASLVGGLVDDGLLLVLSRIAKGMAAAFTAPAALSIITTTFHEGTERNRALGVYSATAAAGYSCGLVLSGLLTQVHWRLVFILPAVIAALVLVVAPMVIRENDVPRRRTGQFDIGGAITITAGSLLLIYGLVQAPEVGWFGGETLAAIGLAVALLVSFVLIEHRHSNPGVPLRIFRSVRLSAANLLALMFMGASIGWQFIAVLYLQQVMGYSALTTALALLPMGIVVVIVAQFATARLIARFGARAVATTGMGVQAAGILLFAQAGLNTDYVMLLLPAVVLHGIGNGLVFPTMNISGLAGVADQEQGLASGLITASTQIGAGIGVAVLTGVSTAFAVGTDTSGQLAGYQAAFVASGIFSLIGLIVAAVGLPRLRHHDIVGQPASTTATKLSPADAVSSN